MKKIFVFIVIIIFVIPVYTASAQEKQEIRDLMEKVKNLESQMEKIGEETEARRKLIITKEETVEREKEILTSVDKEEYTVEKKKSIGMTYNISYGYSAADRLVLDVHDVVEGAHEYNHSMTHSISVSYGLLDNLTVNTGVPFVYRYYKTGASGSKDVTGIGDMSFGMSWQPIKRTKGGLSTTFSGSVTLPTGRSPYKINPNTEISTGNGLYSISTGLNLSKPIDPLIVYGGLSYSRSFNFNVKDLHLNVGDFVLEEVEPGDSIGFKMGMAYALSYRASINLGFNYSYGLSTTYHYSGHTKETPIGTSASFSIGTGWKITPKTTISVGLGISLIGGDDFTLSVGIPFTF